MGAATVLMASSIMPKNVRGIIAHQQTYGIFLNACCLLTVVSTGFS